MLKPARPISSESLFRMLKESGLDLPEDCVWLRITFAIDRPVTVTAKVLLRVQDEFKPLLARYQLVERGWADADALARKNG